MTTPQQPLPLPAQQSPSPGTAAPSGYGAPPSQPYQPGATAVRPSGGGTAWGMGFLAYIPIPIVGQLIGGTVMAIVGARQRRRGGLVGAQGRHAANWGMTYLALTVVCIVGALVLGMLSNSLPEQRALLSGSALTLLGIWLLGVNATHVIVCIVGLVRANQLREFRCPVAIPFLRG